MRNTREGGDKLSSRVMYIHVPSLTAVVQYNDPRKVAESQAICTKSYARSIVITQCQDGAAIVDREQGMGVTGNKLFPSYIGLFM